MLIFTGICSGGSKIIFNKYNSTGDMIKEITLERGKEECYSADVRNINGGNNFLISWRESIFVNETYIKILHSDSHSNQGYCSAYFNDLSLVFLKSPYYIQRYYPKIYFYDSQFNLKAEKFILPFNSSKWTTRGSKVIATETLYHMLIFYNEIPNLIIKTE